MDQATAQMRQHIGYFVLLTDEEWNALVPYLTIKSLPKHHYFIQQGSFANQIGVVLTGQVRQFYSKDGQERTGLATVHWRFSQAAIGAL